ncbi:MAG: replication initiator protein [Microvirus sp.]|nr:MAG: replication initiator protein [Microvirus sp.]
MAAFAFDVPCYKPIEGYRAIGGGVTFNRKLGYVDVSMRVPCGRCIGCKVERSKMWAIRCMHESSLHKANCFLTLTYDPEHLPVNGSLNGKHLSGFIKRLRQHIKRNFPENGPISYFGCGEYGDELSRPHYHAIIFNFDFPDKTFWKRTAAGHMLFTSSTVERIWGHGAVYIGAVTYDSCAYVARYVLKKITGDAAADHYAGKTPEFLRMSLRPAIGKRWINKWNPETYPADTVIMDGKEHKPPRYYDKQLRRNERDKHDDIKKARVRRALQPDNFWNSTPERLAVRETVATARTQLKRRNLE